MSGAGRHPDRIVISPDERRSAVVDVIRGARHRLSLSLFRCTDQSIFVELARAIDRGVEVDVLVTSRSKGRKKLRQLWDTLETTGADIHPYTDPVVKYHAKYLVADDGPAVIASLNFTRKCFRRTVDALVFTHDRAVVDGLRRLMAADREGATLPGRLPDRLIIGPERARQQLTELITQARSSIRLIDAKASDPALTRLMQARQADGVAVDMHHAKRLNGLQVHGKIMLIDGKIGVVGSLALSALCLDFRREVAITVREPGAVAALTRLFDEVGPSAAPSAEAAIPGAS